MAGKTVTRSDLADAVYREIGLSRNESAKIVESVLSLIGDALNSGETVKISSFGSFSVRKKGERIGRNPKTGEEVAITPRRVLTFRASHVLKDWINGEGDMDNLKNISSDNKVQELDSTIGFASEIRNKSSGESSEENDSTGS